MCRCDFFFFLEAFVPLPNASLQFFIHYFTRREIGVQLECETEKILLSSSLTSFQNLILVKK
jgi:hypothetical protein